MVVSSPGNLHGNKFTLRVGAVAALSLWFFYIVVSCQSVFGQACRGVRICVFLAAPRSLVVQVIPGQNNSSLCVSLAEFSQMTWSKDVGVNHAANLCYLVPGVETHGGIRVSFVEQTTPKYSCH
jgi:hypothetical protein